MAGLQHQWLTAVGVLALMPAYATASRLKESLGLDDAWVLLSASLSTASGARRAAERRPEVASLLAVGAATRTRFRPGPKDPSWFDGDNEPEEALPGAGHWLRHMRDVPLRFFHEAMSGGPSEAWQTHYPAVGHSLQTPEDSVLREANQQWRLTEEGWIREQSPRLDGARRGATKASWFDPTVNDVDAFGRRDPPPLGSAKRLVREEYGDLWVERSVNTTIKCPTRGCMGRSMLQAFDPSTEEATNCHLNVLVFPTDFDNRHSRENIEFWRVNGFVVQSECSVGESGCTARRPLVSCLRDFSVDDLIDGNGAMLLEGKLNGMVDECPYEGNLLSSVAQVTCLVRQKADMRPSPPTPAPPPELSDEAQEILKTCRLYSTPLRCREPGCTAETALTVNPTMAYFGGTFTMNITFVITDFDQSESEEQIDFVSLEGRGTLAEKVTPNRNQCPCNTGLLDASVSRETFRVVQEVDVTKEVLKAKPLKVMAKISELVDECASNGYLLDGIVEVACTPPDNFTLQVLAR
uniref:Uncharacterized protein n=1 Tax=Alexandrium catenella TaxID=2925 RepID=A0A7S1SAN3_ALECA